MQDTDGGSMPGTGGDIQRRGHLDIVGLQFDGKQSGRQLPPGVIAQVKRPHIFSVGLPWLFTHLCGRPRMYASRGQGPFRRRVDIYIYIYIYISPPFRSCLSSRYSLLSLVVSAAPRLKNKNN